MTDGERGEPAAPGRPEAAREERTPRADFRRLGIVARPHTREAIRTAGELADWLVRRGREVAVDEPIQRARGLHHLPAFDPLEPYDLVVVLGGDGTLLSTARVVASTSPLLGVNLGRLGFLTEIGRQELYQSLLRVFAGDYRLEERSMFDVELHRRGRVINRFRAFNDAVIAKSARAQIIELELEIDGHRMSTYRADGLIIATPNGSTAYNLSAGGPIVYPSLRVAVITPICPHALTLRPIVVPDSEAIEVTLLADLQEVFLTVDGQDGARMAPKDMVVLQRSPDSVQLVRRIDRTFYDSLRNKLKWGG
ncbi:MAG: NAD(+)/NADH kinase [Acidobacteriota bacterium]